MTRRLLVLGGNGFVGQHICKAAVNSGHFLVRSLSRSGPPPHVTASWVSQVEWTQGDVFDPAIRTDVFKDVQDVVSTIGAFGSNEWMEKMCGDATIEALTTAQSQTTCTRFAFVSSAHVGHLTLSPSMPLYGYFHGKQRAEHQLQSTFPDGFLILRPGFMYGPRAFGAWGGALPLHWIGAPMAWMATQLGSFSRAIQWIPFVGHECASMVHVEDLAAATLQWLLAPPQSRICTAADIRAMAKTEEH